MNRIPIATVLAIFMGTVVPTSAQQRSSSTRTAQQDTLIKTVRIGYANGSLGTLAGAIDQVTEDRMNKGLMTSSLDALSGQAAGVQVSSGGNLLWEKNRKNYLTKNKKQKQNREKDLFLLPIL